MSDNELEQKPELAEAVVNDVLAEEGAPSLVPSLFATGELSLENILEAALMAAGEPLSVEQLCALFDVNERPQGRDVRSCLQEMAEQRSSGAIELKEVASGWRFQVREAYAHWVKRLFSEKPQRYSRALLETLAIIGYRQPVTRGEIEEIRGVAVSTNIMRTLQEREWIRVLGHKELPGRPAMYGTTREFLDYFNLKSLDELPSLAELQDLDKINIDLDLPHPDQAHSDAEAKVVAVELAEAEAQSDMLAANALEVETAEVSMFEQTETDTPNSEQADDDLPISDNNETLH